MFDATRLESLPPILEKDSEVKESRSNSTEVPEAMGILVQGPFEVPQVGPGVIVDKQTAESVLQGANVYAPGVLNCMSMQVGGEVTIVSELGEVIASGKALMSENEVLKFRKGLAVEVNLRRFNGPHILSSPSTLKVCCIHSLWLLWLLCAFLTQSPVKQSWT